MEILQEIGSYAGLAAILGLAVLSALYFSQARDVRRLREWAGRAPERGGLPSDAAAGIGGSDVQPVARPAGRPAAARPVPGGTPPPVPRPPGTRPGPVAPAAGAATAAAAGAAPIVARGPAPATPAAAAGNSDRHEDSNEAADGIEATDIAEHDVDVTKLDTVVHPPPRPGDEDDGDPAVDDPVADGDEAGGEHEADPALVAEDGDDEGLSEHGGDHADETAVYETGDFDAAEDTGEWRPEDEHSGIDFTDEHDVAPLNPPADTPQPPQPPPPYPRRGPATGAARANAGGASPYAEAADGLDRDDPPPVRRGDGGGRRTVLGIAVAVVALAIGAFAVLQVTGGGDSDPGTVGLSAGDGDGDDGGSAAGGAGGGGPIDRSRVTVAVLNGTTVPGLAATIGDRIVGQGFQLGTVTNSFDQERAESVVLYATGREREAAAVGRRLDIAQREPIDAESQALAGDATVVVVTGADQNQQ